MNTHTETGHDIEGQAPDAGRRNLLGHRGTPEDVAMAVAYLCGPEGRYLTGQTLHVNGGSYLP